MTNRIIAVGNLKGGTGKSTIAVNLACCLAEKQRSVLLVDADPQGTAAAWLRDGPHRLGIASAPLGRADDHAMWADEIREQRACHERIVIDLPPQTGECFEAALRVADLLVVPLTLSEVDLHATAQALAVLHRMRRTRDGRPSCLLVPSKIDRRTSLGRRASASLARLGWEVGPALGQRAAHAEAFRAGKWIGVHAPGSAGHMEMRALAEQVQGQLARCKAAEEPAREYLPCDGAIPPAAEVAPTPGASARFGALCLSLIDAVLSKLKRAEQQAYF
ncbi:MAG: AAA family ATPase [Geminicoccaceae bacterium]